MEIKLNSHSLSDRLSNSSRFALEPVSPFLVLPNHQDGGGIEDRRVGATEYAHQQDDDEVPDARPAEERQRQQRNHDGQLGIDGPVKGLDDRMVDDRTKFNAAVDA